MCYEKVLSDQTTVKRTAWVDLQQNHLYLADYEIHCRCINPNMNFFFPLDKIIKLTTVFLRLPFIDDKVRHNIVKVAVQPRAAGKWFRSKL